MEICYSPKGVFKVGLQCERVLLAVYGVRAANGDNMADPGLQLDRVLFKLTLGISQVCSTLLQHRQIHLVKSWTGRQSSG